MPKSQRIDFDELKARADFRAVVAHYGLTLLGSGEQAKVHCPFHDDERPSCSVNLGRGLFHCHAGSCGASGNVLDFVHRMETRDGATVSLRQAGIRLAEICGVNLGPEKATQTRQEPQKASTAKETAFPPPQGQNHAQRGSEGQETASQHAVEPTRNKPLGFALNLDHEHPYLVERQVPGLLIMPFGLGFCAKGIMAGRLCIPIHNADGQLVAYAGRWVSSLDELPEGEEKYKLPKGFHKSLELFNLHRVKACQHLVIVEGYFGTLRLHSLRIPAVGLMGSSISEAQVTLLREHCPTLRFVTVLLDGDEAGRKAADSVAARLSRHWWTHVAELSEGSQPDTVELDVLEHLLRRKRQTGS